MDRQSSPVKIMFQILQCLHHLVMLQDDANTAGPHQAFFQKAKELDRFVRPAMPTRDLADKIKSINLAWAFEIRSTLVTHYRTQLDFLSGSLKAWNLSATDCAQAKLKAKEWAKRNFGRKLKPQTLSEFDRRVQQIFAPPKSTQTQHSDRPQRILGRAIPVNIVDVQPVPTDQPSANVNRSASPTPGPSGTNKAYSQAAKSPPSNPRTSLPKSPRQPKITKFPALGKQKHSVEHLKANWEIPKVMKDILMIGTSNFSRIPWVSRDDAQILCYPGLKLQSLLHLFNFFKYGPDSPNPGRKPRKVVISCGLNDKTLAPSTTNVALGKIINKAKRIFPGSEIYLAQIAFSSKLPVSEQNNLKIMNDKIKSLATQANIKYIPCIPANKFDVGSDNIHWTENCALAHLEHFFDHLN